MFLKHFLLIFMKDSHPDIANDVHVFQFLCPLSTNLFYCLGFFCSSILANKSTDKRTAKFTRRHLCSVFYRGMFSVVAAGNLKITAS